MKQAGIKAETYKWPAEGIAKVLRSEALSLGLYNPPSEKELTQRLVQAANTVQNSASLNQIKTF